MLLPRILSLLAFVFLMTSFSAPTPARAQEQLRVTTTFSILDDIVRNVGGDSIDLQTIVPAGGDAHTFDPNPEQVAGIGDADVIFAIGLEFEPWLPDMISASGSSAELVTVSDGLTLIHTDEEREEHDHESEDEDHEHDSEEAEHDHGDTNPHVWGDVGNVIAIVGVVRDVLSAEDPANASVYQDNAASYIAELEQLDGWIHDQVQLIPEEHRKLVTTHNTFAYFAEAYGFEIIGDALASGSTEGGDPSAAEFAETVEQIKATGVPAIFPENVVNGDLIESIAAEAGVEVGPTLFTDALGEPGSEGDTYITMQQFNVTSIVTALSA